MSNRNKIRQLLRNADHILLIDAYLSPQSLDIINSIIEEPIYLICNKYENKKNYKLYNMKSKENFIECIKEEYEKGKNICIVSNVKSFLDIIKNNKYVNLDLKKTMTIDSTVNNSVMDNLKEEVCKYSALLYSPSCGPGVNIDVLYYDVMFVYAQPSINSCNSRYLAQMVFRVRHLKEKTMYYFCEKYNGKFSVDFNTVAKTHERKINNNLNLIKKYINYNFVERDAIIVNNNFYYKLDLENPWCRLLMYDKVLTNRCLNNYTDELFYYISESGMKIYNIIETSEDENGEENEKLSSLKQDIKDTVKHTKEERKKDKLESFSNAGVYFDDDILNTIKNQIINGECSEEYYQCYIKSKLFNNFNHDFLMENSEILKLGKKEYIKNVVNIAHEMMSDVYDEISKDIKKMPLIELCSEEVDKLKSPKLILIKELCETIGIKNSYDTETEINLTKLQSDENIQKYFKDNFDAYTDVMKCQCKYDNKKFNHISYIINQSIKTWSGFKFDKGRGKNKKIKKLICSYNLSTETINELIKNYNISIPEEKIKVERNKNGHIYYDDPVKKNKKLKSLIKRIN